MAFDGVQFWFEFASTYSYVSAMRIERLANERGIAVEWKPFLLGPILSSAGWNDSPFNLYPVKGAYMWRDMKRLCEAENIPFKRPSQFPRNSLLAARVAWIAADEGWCPQFARSVYQANFGDDKDISDWEVLAPIVTSIGRDADETYKAALDGKNKDRLKTQTEKAAKLGIFGAPSFMVGKELFWGNDRLEAALEWYQRHGAA
jgi:2-hydroxychromene-2-carboxylate isomerase